MTRLRTEAKDLLELVLVPGLAAVLPWRVCFRLFRWLSRFNFLYRAQCEEALFHARQRGWAADEKHWLRRHRLMRLVDHADYYLVRTRSRRWIDRHVDVQGQWPTPGEAGLLLSFHWGAAMWSLPHARAAGLHAHALVAPLQGAHFAGRSVLRRYAYARTAIVARSLGYSTLDVSASLRPAIRALRDREQVLAIVDVPADQVSASQSIELLGMKARVPKALFRLAVDQAIPVTIFLGGFHDANGRRFLSLRQLGVYTDADALIRDVFCELEQAIATNPAAWHFWGQAERFFSREPDDAPTTIAAGSKQV